VSNGYTDAELLNTLQFVDAKEKEFFATAQLGFQVREFLAGPAGRYLHGRAKLELEDVKNEMLDLYPYSLRGIRKWRELKVRRLHAENFMRWCADALSEGAQAEKELEEYRT
jgi:hypothetical protein